ncbi:uncharacterized protein LOC110096621 [Dendrobium catenatum]|uniref:uncharacterized protein LOC110096621 n=1 Tax=Dendrobium catenatum TaxID=906689 RepID=UPI0009F738CF|nr:uncharacterized protein LOC110096621 [Dendrobium catenatum]
MVNRRSSRIIGAFRSNSHQSRNLSANQRRPILVREEFPRGNVRHALRQRNFQESSPLTEAIIQHPIPVGFKVPNVESYDGTTEPYEHIDYYRTIMHIQRASDALLCQFVANRRIAKDSSHLSRIRQNELESLKDYFQRFSTEARQIPGVDPELLRGVFLGGLRPGPFYAALMRDTIHSYADLIHRVEAQISADEAINAHVKQFEQINGKRKGVSGMGNSFSQQKKQGKNNLPHRSPSPRWEPRQEEYTPLNISRANVLMVVRNQDTLKWLNPLKSNTGNADQYCHFHRSRGHTTEACKQLKDEIERLIC